MTKASFQFRTRPKSVWWCTGLNCVQLDSIAWFDELIEIFPSLISHSCRIYAIFQDQDPTLKILNSCSATAALHVTKNVDGEKGYRRFVGVKTIGYFGVTPCPALPERCKYVIMILKVLVNYICDGLIGLKRCISIKKSAFKILASLKRDNLSPN